METYPNTTGLLNFFDTISSDNTESTTTIAAVSGHRHVLRWLSAGYDDNDGEGTVTVKDGTTTIFTGTVSGRGTHFYFGDYPLMTSEGALMDIVISAGGASIAGHVNGCYQ